MLSKETAAQPVILSPSGEVTQWREPSALPQIEALQWQSYRGGSYDGFEEVGFTFLGALLLTPILALFTLALMRVRQPPSNRPLQPTSGEAEQAAAQGL